MIRCERREKNNCDKVWGVHWWMDGWVPQRSPQASPSTPSEDGFKGVFKVSKQLAKQRLGEALFQVEGVEQAKTQKDE